MSTSTDIDMDFWVRDNKRPLFDCNLKLAFRSIRLPDCVLTRDEVTMLVDELQITVDEFIQGRKTSKEKEKANWEALRWPDREEDQKSSTISI